MEIRSVVCYWLLQMAVVLQLTNGEPRFENLRIYSGRMNLTEKSIKDEKNILWKSGNAAKPLPMDSNWPIGFLRTGIDQKMAGKPLNSQLVAKNRQNLTNSPIYYFKLSPSSSNYVSKQKQTTLVHSKPPRWPSKGNTTHIHVAIDYNNSTTTTTAATTTSTEATTTATTVPTTVSPVSDDNISSSFAPISHNNIATTTIAAATTVSPVSDDNISSSFATISHNNIATTTVAAATTPTLAPATTEATTTAKNSRIIYLKGPFLFNGKPGNVSFKTSSHLKILQKLYPRLKSLNFF